jgi:ribosome biogenesis GTPase A
MAEYMTPEREEYIAKLEGQIQAIDSILKMDLGTVVSTELRKQLRTLKTEADTVLRKLKNNEFEIAIVGMEKAGKSTFANALMKNKLLPSKDARCTFTSTKIEYSGDDNDDSATVSFYTADEFDKDFLHHWI